MNVNRVDRGSLAFCALSGVFVVVGKSVIQT